METVFAHERLDAYIVAREFVARAADLLREFPRGEAALADQLRRAGDSVLLNLCEGAARTAPRDKAHFYDIAAASGAECAGALAVVAARNLATAGAIADTRWLLHRTVSLLGGLARSARRRASAS